MNDKLSVAKARENQDRISIAGDRVTYWDVYNLNWCTSSVDAVPVNVLRALSSSAQRRIKAAYRRKSI